MNTITTTASTKAILAIDLGKYKSVACVHDPATGECAFTTFETTRAELRKLITAESTAPSKAAGVEIPAASLSTRVAAHFLVAQRALGR